MTCIFLKPPRADTQGSDSSAAPARTVQNEEEEKDIHFYNPCVTENLYSFLVNAQDLISYF